LTFVSVQIRRKFLDTRKLTTLDSSQYYILIDPGK
jgi:hypothetical protein